MLSSFKSLISKEGKYMNINKLQDKLSKFASDRDWEQFHTPKNLAMALSVEASELVEIFQWLTSEESNSPNDKLLSQIESEVADVSIYLLRICSVLDINLSEAIDYKIKLNAEKYPIHLSKGRNGVMSKIRKAIVGSF